ncbi:phage holin family protein [Metaclostridioides mangenotii]|uniref:phage holin family protein n=1 Tax=Metaclostridioides mangenotii TaxID=1540 RepID=UPI0009DDD971
MTYYVSNNGTWVFRTLVCYFYIANERLSILKNCSQIGIKVPVQIKEALEQ